MKTKYTVDYFLNKFSAIPDNKWKQGSGVGDNHSVCALGHCGDLSATARTEKGLALSRLFKRAFFHDRKDIATDGEAVWIINDGSFEHVEVMHLGTTPKNRILNALKLIKAGVKV